MQNSIKRAQKKYSERNPTKGIRLKGDIWEAFDRAAAEHGSRSAYIIECLRRDGYLSD